MRIVILFFIFTSNILAQEIIGIPRIVDGDTIYINEYKIRLEGIDAPEMRQQCKKERLKISSIIGFTFYKNYSCGEVSKENLELKIDRSKIKCISSTKDRYKRYLAKCFIDDIQKNMYPMKILLEKIS